MTTQNSVLLKHVRALVCATATNPIFDNRRMARETLKNALEEYGFSGMWSATDLKRCGAFESQCIAYIDELVKVSMK